MADKRNNMVEKDNVCRDFAKSGYCRFEDKCKFEHPGGSGKRPSTGPDMSVCKDYARGNCEYGARCRFKHPTPCKDFLAGNCTYPNCRFFHPPGAQGANANGPPMGGPGGKRGNDFDDLPPQYCRDFVYNGVCRRPRCSFLHEMPNKRRAGPGPDGPFPPVGPGGPPGWNDGPQQGPLPGPGPDPNYVNPELKAYVSQLELKVTMYEEKIKDLEKRCDQYEDFNKLLTERNDELKAKLEAGHSRGYQGGSGGSSYPGTSGGSYPAVSGDAGYQGSSGGSAYQGQGSGGGSGYQGHGGSGGYHTSSQPGGHSSSSRSSSSRPKYYNN